MKTLILFITIALSQSLYAEALPDLPEAIDAGWNGEKTCELLYERQSVRAFQCSFAPGIGHEKHFHYPHFGYVLQGGEMSITNETGVEVVRQTTTGKSWSSDKITIHSVLNTGETTTSYLIIEPKTEKSN